MLSLLKGGYSLIKYNHLISFNSGQMGKYILSQELYTTI